MIESPPLTPRQRWLAAAVFLACAASRLIAISRTIWDADEVRFALALRDYDVAAHRPHPPGFPLFIALARLIHLAVASEFRSLQIIVVVSSLALAPAMFFLCREMRAPFESAIVASALIVFFPNVWFYGGTAFSDVPALTLLVLAIALLLGGARNPAALYAGSLCLGVAAGFRPQSILVAMVPFDVAAARQKRRIHVALAMLIVVAIVAVSYGEAARITGWQRYVEAVRAHEAYIAATDSFRSAIRPPLYRLVDDFFVRPWRAPLINAVLSFLGLVSIASAIRGRRTQPILFIATFAPLCVVAWLTLDHFSASRFSIGYAPLMAFLAADGLHALTGSRPRLEAAGAFALVAMMIVWTWPSLREVRDTASPVVRAMEWVNRVPATRLTLMVDPRLDEHAQLLLRNVTRVGRASDIPAPWREGERAFLIREEIAPRPGAQNFSRPHDRLRWLARQRYFDISVIDAGPPIVFGDGWYGEESDRGEVWRWMGPRGTLTLPPAAGPATLALRLRVPVRALRGAPTITIRFNGAVIDSIAGSAPVFERRYRVTPRRGTSNELVIETSEAAEGIDPDTRTLGIRLEDIRWSGRRSELEVHRDGEPRLDTFPVFHRR